MRVLRPFVPCVLLASILGFAEGKHPADYPLRLHIFNRSETKFYHNRAVDETKGDGRANLFENGEPRAMDFSFECPERLMPSFGFETYPARWKKPNAELVILVAEKGKPNKYFTCDLKATVKDYAYVMVNGRLMSESPAKYKEWMTRHEYDPEHGKDRPVNLGGPSQ